MADGSFEVVLLEEAREYVFSLTLQAQKKIYYNIQKVSGGVKDSELFKKLDGSDDIWELRTKYDGVEHRLLAFWDKTTNSLVVATHGFAKKRWGVPHKEIAKAEEIRRKYYESKDE